MKSEVFIVVVLSAIGIVAADMFTNACRSHNDYVDEYNKLCKMDKEQNDAEIVAELIKLAKTWYKKHTDADAFASVFGHIPSFNHRSTDCNYHSHSAWHHSSHSHMSMYCAMSLMNHFKYAVSESYVTSYSTHHTSHESHGSHHHTEEPTTHHYHHHHHTHEPTQTPKPYTSAPTTSLLGLVISTTKAPITHAPHTTQGPVTPIQELPSTTAKPATHQPTTSKPQTHKPTTAKPLTHKPTTAKPLTHKPTTAEPQTHQPTTSDPHTAKPTTFNPQTDQPTTSNTHTAQPGNTDERSCSITQNGDPAVSMPCGHGSQCLTEVIDAPGSRAITRRCASRDECYSKWWLGSSDRSECVYIDDLGPPTYNKVCTFCCDTDMCNVGPRMVPTTLTTFIGSG